MGFLCTLKLGKYENIAIAFYTVEMMITLKLLNWEQKKDDFPIQNDKKEGIF